MKCREKLKHQRNKANHGNDSVSNNFNTINLDRQKIVNNDCHKCICGKNCKKLRGLKVHQRSSLNKDNIIIDNIEQDAIENHFVATNRKQVEFSSLEEGVKLPESPEDWRLANLCFHSELST